MGIKKSFVFTLTETKGNRETKTKCEIIMQNQIGLALYSTFGAHAEALERQTKQIRAAERFFKKWQKSESAEFDIAYSEWTGVAEDRVWRWHRFDDNWKEGYNFWDLLAYVETNE